MQQAAWEAVNSTLDAPDDPAAASVAVDDQGYVRAMVGGRDFANAEGQSRPRSEGRGIGPRRRLGLQADRADPGRRSGRLDRLEVRLAVGDDVRGSQRRRGLGGQQLRRHGAGPPRSRRRHPRLVRHGLRAAHARSRAASVVEMAKRLGIATELPAVNSLVLGSATCQCSTWQPPTAPSRTAACASRQNSSRESSRSTRTATSPCWSSTNRVASRSSLPRWQTPSPTACGKWSWAEPAARPHSARRPRARRHDAGQPGRLVRRLHAEAHGGSVDGLPRHRTRYMDDVHGREVTGGSFRRRSGASS